MRRKTDLFSSFKKFIANVSFRKLQLKKISLNFKTSHCNLKIRDLEAKLCVAFLLFSFWNKLWRVKLKESKHCVEQKTKFNENGMESKMENPTHRFRETNYVLHLYKNRKLKLWWVGAREKKREHFLYRLFRIFFNICVLSQCIMA